MVITVLLLMQDLENVSINMFVEASPGQKLNSKLCFFPLFLIGDWQTAYELTIQGTQKRADYLIKSKYPNDNLCTIIELKRSGSVDAAVEQALEYGRLFQQKRICGNKWCAVGINIPQNFPQQTIEVKYEIKGLNGCLHYQGQFKQQIINNKRTFVDIITFVRANGIANDL